MSAARTSDAICGRDIILDFKTGAAAGVATYERICKAIDVLDKWHPDAVTQFIDQFVDVEDILDNSCRLLVQKLARLEWRLLPVEIRPRFSNMLRASAIQHLSHMDCIIDCFVRHLLLPADASTSSPALVEKSSPTKSFPVPSPSPELKDIFEFAIDSLASVVDCVPMSKKLVMKTVIRNYPHFSVPVSRYTLFFQNLIRLGNRVLPLRSELWSLLIDNLSQLDAFILKADKESGGVDDLRTDISAVFALDEETQSEKDKGDILNVSNAERTERQEKLDICMVYVFSYISKAYEKDIPDKLLATASWVPDVVPKSGLYNILLDVFEEFVLMTDGVKNIAFIWFYICSFDVAITDNFIQWLWSFVLKPCQSPNEWKKAHGAVAHISGLLSRATFTTTRMSMEWIQKLAKWCSNYINEVIGTTMSVSAGSIRHGTFYAVCQSILLTFCFRYSEFNEEDLVKLRHFGIGHIIHCSLEPLKYISPPVAFCFASVSRSLQLVYCNHIVPLYSNYDAKPFEPIFPFHAYSLTRSSSFVLPLVRHFVPLTEDLEECGSSFKDNGNSLLLRTNGFKNSVESTEPFDFLYDVDEDNDFVEDLAMQNMNQLSEGHIFPISEGLSIYSRSPGLCKFITSPSSLMDLS